MSGTGKSTLIRELAARGYRAVDTDTDEWSDWVTVPDRSEGSSAIEERDWVWREDRIGRLLSEADADILFLSGCKSNQGKFYPQFDEVILLSAPVPVLSERLAGRTTNPYGKRADELAQVLEYVRTVEPLLRRTASMEIDTSAPVEVVLDTILRRVLKERTNVERAERSHRICPRAGRGEDHPRPLRTR